MKRTVLAALAVLLLVPVIGAGVAFGGSGKGKWKQLADRVTALEQQVLAQQGQIDDLEGRVRALEGGSGGGGGGGGGGGIEPPSPPAPGLVVDQQQLSTGVTTGGAFGAVNTGPLAQQFTPAQATPSAVSLRILVTSRPGVTTGPDASIVVHAGSDLSGSVLATSSLNYTVPPFPRTSEVWLSGVLDPAVTLTPGQLYTIELKVADGRPSSCCGPTRATTRTREAVQSCWAARHARRTCCS